MVAQKTKILAEEKWPKTDDTHLHVIIEYSKAVYKPRNNKEPKHVFREISIKRGTRVNNQQGAHYASLTIEPKYLGKLIKILKKAQKEYRKQKPKK